MLLINCKFKDGHFADKKLQSYCDRYYEKFGYYPETINHIGIEFWEVEEFEELIDYCLENDVHMVDRIKEIMSPVILKLFQ